MISRTNIVLAVLLVAVVALSTVVRVDHSRPNYEFLPEMKYSPAWSAFAENPHLPGGRTLQAPVRGTIARGETPLHYTAAPEDAIRAGEELQNPFDLSRPSTKLTKQETKARQERLRASVQRGGDVYRAFCICCHGPAGAGDGSVAQRGLPSPSLLSEQSRKMNMKDGQLFHILTYGRDTKWPGSMLPFAAQLSHESRWDVINYVRDLQKKAPATAP